MELVKLAVGKTGKNKWCVLLLSFGLGHVLVNGLKTKAEARKKMASLHKRFDGIPLKDRSDLLDCLLDALDLPR